MTTDPAPLILIQPDGDALRFNAYGLTTAQIIDALRRTLLYTAAQHAGLATIDATIPAQAAIAANGHSPETVPATRGKPGPKPGFKKARVTVDPDDLFSRADHPQDR